MSEQTTRSGRLLGLSRGKGLSAFVRSELKNRHGTPTSLRYILLDAADERLAEGYVMITRIERTVVEVPMDILEGHTVWGAMLALGDVVVLRWRSELRDPSGQLLARKTYACEYRGPF
ncbi:hypothetical protein [Polyangium sp. 15x6]|uniref:hypothetical protein n=1 Tax=Polyangium sp. 15x6 TaxID=3042687 RepID=UPI00249A8B26|nr:hypothetical protein [Polyangium sp. 15x6]MDI3284716.1 hypothetical protein [Polyangium sp. 15x6]